MSAGLCGSPSSSVNAWCFRWTATHSFVEIPVVEPQAKSETPGNGRMQHERAMGCRSVQVDRGAEDRHLNKDGRNDQAQNE